jgi:hypothetical protein
MIVKKGQMITFAEGEYSDYCVNGLVRANKDFNLYTLKEEWMQENTKEEDKGGWRRYRRTVTGMEFLPWLVKMGLVEDVDYLEVHTGGYGEAAITWTRQSL